MKRVAIALAAVAGIYAAAVAGFYVAMLQPPARFGAIMSRVPMPAMMVLPFRPLWMSARAGSVKAGDAAPDFEMSTLDRRGRERLSELWRERPVALIFGSYT